VTFFEATGVVVKIGSSIPKAKLPSANSTEFSLSKSVKRFVQTLARFIFFLLLQLSDILIFFKVQF